MKYLFAAMPEIAPIPQDQLDTLLDGAKRWPRPPLDEGRLDCAYIFEDGGCMMIGNAESNDDAFKLIESYPLYPYFQWEVKPLYEWDPGFGTIIEGNARGAG